MPSVRRSLPEGYHRLHEPRFDAAVDLEAHLALLPADATCKGMFFTELIRLGARAPAELCRAAGIPERRYSGFFDYPAAENLRLAVAVAKLVYGPKLVGEGLRRAGQTAFDIVLRTQVGRSLLGTLGADIEQVLLTAPKVLKHVVNFGRLSVEKVGSHAFLLRAQELPTFLETYQVGVIEGALRHCRATAKIRVALDNPATGMAEVRIVAS
jgi:uncharacterized protein (TIGR02265 family)